ncbi:MAG: HDOD domain-containing protein [bacterium]
MSQSVAKHLLDLQEIPTLPLVATKIIQMTNDPRSSASDLQNLISHDPAIAAKVLKLANSAFYGLPGKVSNLNRAVTLLGFNTVRSLALSISVIEAFPGGSATPHFNRALFWEHSLAVAEGARILAARSCPELKDEAHMAGLFHDIGKIVMDQCFSEYFTSAMRLAYENRISTSDAEMTIMKVDHAELGAQVAEKWNFPSSLVEVIRYHHAISFSTETPLVGIVALADDLCMEWGFGDTGESVKAVPPPSLLALHCGSDIQLSILQTKLEAEVEKSAELLSLLH